jgi:hypothetical protein
MIIHRIISKIWSYVCRFSNRTYVNYLRNNGIEIGGVINLDLFQLKLI